jgi:UDP-N-acetylglucosamine acyltransferase
MIHPTAVVAPGASLGAGVEIGPYAVVESGAEIGDGCVIGAHALVGRYVRMGAGNSVGAGAVIGGDPQDLGFNSATESYVRIGNRNRIREHCTVHRAAKACGETVLGDDCFLMVGSHVGHDTRLGNRVIMANSVLLGGHVEVGDGVFLGGGTSVHQFVKVGRMAVTQGNSSLSKSVPPYLMTSGLNTVVGLNVIGLKRGGFSGAQRAEVKEAFDGLFRSGRNVSQAVAWARGRSWGEASLYFWDFVEGAGKRGICGWRGRYRVGREDAEHPPEEAPAQLG